MSKTKTRLCIVALALSCAPGVYSADNLAVSSNSDMLPLATGAIGTACVALISLWLHGANQPYNHKDYWCVETVTQELQESLKKLAIRTHPSTPEIVWDNGSGQSLPKVGNVWRSHGKAELTITYNNTDQKWHVQQCIFKPTNFPSGHITVKASYTDPRGCAYAVDWTGPITRTYQRI